MTFEYWFYNKRNDIMCPGEDRFTFECFKQCWKEAREDLKNEILAELNFKWTCEDVCPDECTGLKAARSTIKELFVK